MVAEDPNLIGTFIRLAWHSSGTYDSMTKTGGSGGGTMRFKEELNHGANAGLSKMVDKLEPLHAQFPGVSYADTYTLAGKVAIEAAKGPTIPWKAGRVDALTPDAVTPDGRLPDADKGSPDKTIGHLRKDVFYRMGFNDQEIVALSGAHAHTVWIGDVVVRREAVGIETYELNRNLLLNDGPRADSVPNLELETGDVVSAGHASATGRFDDEQLTRFYVAWMERGLALQVVLRNTSDIEKHVAVATSVCTEE